MKTLCTLLGFSVLLAYLHGACPTFYWLDSSELTAAAWGLGVAHPPGHPLPSLLARVVCLLPLGTIAFRVTLASALEAAACACLTFLICAQVLRRLRGLPRGPAWLVPLACSVAALCVGLSYAVWFQAVRAEVYALNLMLLLLGVHLVLRWDESGDRRPLLVAGLVAGLALCNHHFLVLLALPAVGVFVLWRRPRSGWRRAAAGLVLAGMLGLTTLAYLPLRAPHHPEANWGAPSTPERFFWVVSAKAFQKALNKAAKESVEHRAVGALFALVGGLGPVAAVVALGGFYFLFRRRESRGPAGLLAGAVGLNLLSPLTVGFDPLNPDALGYLAVAVALFSPGVAALVVLVGGALHARPASRGYGPALVGLVAVALPVYQLVVNLPRCDLRRHRAAEETARTALDRPQGALMFSAYFETIFNSWAMRAAADYRPDVGVFHRHFLPQPGYIEDLAPALPRVAAMAPRWREAQHLLAPDLRRLAAHRPVAVEYDLTVSPQVLAGLWPGGLIHSWGPAPGGAQAHKAQILRWHRALGPVRERESVRTVTYTHYLLAHHACQRGLEALAQGHYRAARELAPHSRDLQELARRCGLSAR